MGSTWATGATRGRPPPVSSASMSPDGPRRPGRRYTRRLLQLLEPDPPAAPPRGTEEPRPAERVRPAPGPPPAPPPRAPVPPEPVHPRRDAGTGAPIRRDGVR